MEKYQEFRQRKFLCDIFFDIDGVERDLHRVILATKLENFIAAHSSCTKLGKNNGSCAENRLKLTNFPGGVRIFDIAVDFCYCPKDTIITLENVAYLYYVADYFQMTGEGNLIRGLDDFLENEIFVPYTEMEFYTKCKSPSPAKIHPLVDYRLKNEKRRKSTNFSFKNTDYLKNSIYVYREALEVENKYCLPSDLSRKCLVCICSALNEYVDIEESSYLDLILELNDGTAYHDLILCIRKLSIISENKTTNFTALLILRWYEANFDFSVDREETKNKQDCSDRKLENKVFPFTPNLTFFEINSSEPAGYQNNETYNSIAMLLSSINFSILEEKHVIPILMLPEFFYKYFYGGKKEAIAQILQPIRNSYEVDSFHYAKQENSEDKIKPISTTESTKGSLFSTLSIQKSIFDFDNKYEIVDGFLGEFIENSIRSDVTDSKDEEQIQSSPEVIKTPRRFVSLELLCNLAKLWMTLSNDINIKTRIDLAIEANFPFDEDEENVYNSFPKEVFEKRKLVDDCGCSHREKIESFTTSCQEEANENDNINASEEDDHLKKTREIIKERSKISNDAVHSLDNDIYGKEDINREQVSTKSPNENVFESTNVSTRELQTWNKLMGLLVFSLEEKIKNDPNPSTNRKKGTVRRMRIRGDF